MKSAECCRYKRCGMITSPGNERIKSLVHIRQKAKARKDADVFLSEGIKMFLEAPEERIREVFLSESFSCPDKAVEDAVTEKLGRLSCETVSGNVFSKISDTCSPQGILCVMKSYHYSFSDLLRREYPLLLALEDIRDPGNLGTMIRTGEGAGIDGVILSGETVDIYNPKTIRATMGSIYRVPFYQTQNLQQTIADLQRHGIRVFAAHLDGETAYDACDYTGGCAFLIGNEAGGLKEETAATADCLMRIPMAGAVESLNAGIAAAVLMYEAARQRRNGK